MAKTISTHNGSVANRDHNIRNPKVTAKQLNIDTKLSYLNEILVDEKPYNAYHRIFGKALNDYNAKQKREDRKILDYYNHIKSDKKKHAVYEMIIQVGDNQDTGIYADTERKIIKEFISDWKQRNPNLELIGAYIHADEPDGTLHAHIDYIPVAHGYKNGLSVQNGLVKALGEQGFSTEKKDKITAQIRWEQRENQALESICNKYGIEVFHPIRDGNEKVKHQKTTIYKQNQELKNSGEQFQFQILECERVERKLAELKGELLSAETIQNYYKRNKIFNKITNTVILTWKNYIDLVTTAELVDSVHLQAEKQVKSAELKAKLAIDEANAEKEKYVLHNKLLNEKIARHNEIVRNNKNKHEQIISAINKREKSLEQRENAVKQGLCDNSNWRLNELEEFVRQFKIDGKNLIEAFEESLETQTRGKRL